MDHTKKSLNSPATFVTNQSGADEAGTSLSRLLLAVVVFAAVILLAATGAMAQVPNLEGETFQNAGLRQSKVSCTSDVNGGTLSFSTLGEAVGPYSGSFTEFGDIQFDPITAQVLGGTLYFHVIDANGATVVDGKKSPRDGDVRCSVDEKTGVTTITAKIPTLEYTATVEGSTDAGNATLSMFASRDKALGLTTLLFTEVFHSSNFVGSTLGKITGGGTLAQGEQKAGVTFGFNAQNTENGMKGSGTIIDHNAGVKVKILDVTAFAVSGAHATFSGSAEVNGVVEKYRIDVEDIGEPGKELDTFKLVTSSYGTGGTLSGGNIQVHK